jgi:type IV pilus assembly protein PilA
MVAMAWTEADTAANRGELDSLGVAGGFDQQEDEPMILWSGITGWRLSTPALEARRSRQLSSSDAGFSMVELMVVLLVLGILLAIAIPTFLGTQSAANDRSVQSNLGTALTQAKSEFDSNSQTYDINGAPNATLLAQALSTAQPSLTFLVGNSNSLNTISVAVSADGNGVALGAYSVPGNCFYVVDNTQAETGATGAPYVGTTAVTTMSATPPAGTIGLPTIAGTTYVEVQGDFNKADCNANSPKTSGSPATIIYTTSGFPN